MGEVTIFVDESGTLPDPNDKVIIVAAVGATNPSRIDTIIKQVRKKGSFKKPTGELKFYTVGNKTRRIFLEKIVQENFTISVLVVEKDGKKIPDTPENFAVLCWLLLSDVLGKDNSVEVERILFDKHFSLQKDIEIFNIFLLQHLQKDIVLEHVDSKKDKRVNVADMVAGAVLAYESGKTGEFYEIIAEKITFLKKFTWKKAKRHLFP